MKYKYLSRINELGTNINLCFACCREHVTWSAEKDTNSQSIQLLGKLAVQIDDSAETDVSTKVTNHLNDILKHTPYSSWSYKKNKSGSYECTIVINDPMLWYAADKFRLVTNPIEKNLSPDSLKSDLWDEECYQSQMKLLKLQGGKDTPLRSTIKKFGVEADKNSTYKPYIAQIDLMAVAMSYFLARKKFKTCIEKLNDQGLQEVAQNLWNAFDVEQQPGVIFCLEQATKIFTSATTLCDTPDDLNARNEFRGVVDELQRAHTDVWIDPVIGFAACLSLVCFIAAPIALLTAPACPATALLFMATCAQDTAVICLLGGAASALVALSLFPFRSNDPDAKVMHEFEHNIEQTAAMA